MKHRYNDYLFPRAGEIVFAKLQGYRSSVLLQVVDIYTSSVSRSFYTCQCHHLGVSRLSSNARSVKDIAQSFFTAEIGLSGGHIKAV